MLIGDGTCDRTRLSALLVGAAGVIDKQEPAGSVLETLRAAAEGRPQDDDTTIEELLQAIGDGDGHDVDEKVAVEEKIRRLAHGAAVVRLTKVVSPGFPLFRTWVRDLKDGRRITPFRDMWFSPISVDYVSRVLTKLGMQRRTEVAVLATRLAARADHEA